MKKPIQRLVVDGQLFQTAAWHRGMGKYSLELLDALDKVLSAEWQSIEIILSRHIKLPPEAVAQIKEKVPTAHLVYLDLKPDEIGNKSIARHNRQVIDHHVALSLESGTMLSFLILSAMQGVIYPVFPSSSAIQRLVLFYDLIPLMFYKVYLKNPITRNEYLPRIGELLRADVFLAISKTVANDLAITLGVDRSRIVSIDGGAIPHSTTVDPLNIPAPFILMPTGNDLRKNNRRAIAGFKYFNERNDNRYTLVITSFFKDHEIADLSRLSTNVVFTGNISGAELNYLYEQAAVLLFPSEYEGLGMPILEAIEKNKPVACSNIAVFREISTTAFAYFDPRSVVEIAEALQQVTQNNYEFDKSAYRQILEHYTWQATADKTVTALNNVTLNKDRAKQKLQIFGPNPAQSDTGRAMQEGYAELSRIYDVTYVWETAPNIPELRINYLPYITKGLENEPGMRLTADSCCTRLYHISNEPGCARTLLAALGNPGIVILYDMQLDKAWAALIEQSLVSASRAELEARIEKANEISGTSHLSSLLSNQQAVVVFNTHANKVVQELLKRMRAHAQVVVASRPIAGLVYGEALPEKSETVRMSQTEGPYYFATSPYSDYQNIADISASSVVVFQEGYREQQVLEAMRFGVVGYIPRGANYKLPHQLVRTFGALEDAIKDAEILVASREAFTKNSIANIGYIQERHAPRVWVETLQALLADILGE